MLIEITSLSTDLNMKCRIDRIHTQIIDDKTFDDQGAMGTELNHWEKRLLEVSLF